MTAEEVPLSMEAIEEDIVLDEILDIGQNIPCEETFSHFVLSPDELCEILPDEHQPLRKDQRQSLSPEWANVISQRLNQMFSCVVKARGGAVKKPNSRKKTSPWFRGHLACVESSCGRFYTVLIQNKPLLDEHIQVQVIVKGKMDHSARERGLVARRQMRGKVRHQFLAEKVALRAEKTANQELEQRVQMAQTKVSLLKQMYDTELQSAPSQNRYREIQPISHEDYCADESIVDSRNPMPNTSKNYQQKRCSPYTRVVDIPLPFRSRVFSTQDSSLRKMNHSELRNQGLSKLEQVQLEAETLRKEYYRLKIHKTLLKIREKDPNFSINSFSESSGQQRYVVLDSGNVSDHHQPMNYVVNVIDSRSKFPDIAE